MKNYKILRAFVVPAVAACSLAGAGAAQAADYYASIVASGLDNPRGLAFGPDGALYIAEGGTFNSGPTIPTPEGGIAAVGTSGAITQVLGGVQSRVVTGLPSLTDGSGAATGPQDIAFYNGQGYFVVGLGADPLQRDLLGATGANLAALYSFDAGGTATHIADIGAFERSKNPDGDQFDSNPYHLTAGPGGLLVTDAGGNSLLTITESGAITALTTFPDGAWEQVPTGIAIGPDGAYYIGQLTGVPFPKDGANIFRYDPLTDTQSIFATGFTNVTDIAFDSDGTLYVLQLTDNGLGSGPPLGSIRKLLADGTNELIYGGLLMPTGLEIGPDGAFYVTNFSPVPGIGQVLRVAPVPEPASWALMIGGFALVGSAMRRRRTAVAFA